MNYLVCGYRRTGKDTLCKQFNNIIPFNWLVLGNEHHIFNIKKVKRISFADILKQEVLKKLNLPLTTNVEQIKDQPFKDNKTFRYFLIKEAAEKRSIDPNYYCKLALSNLDLNQSYMITDWRYPNEKIYARKIMKNIITIRVFRKEVKISNNKSEHQLDKENTDFVLIPLKNNQDEFKELIKIFPQYQNYR